MSPQIGLCCTTTPVWQLPELSVPKIMLEMNYGCGSTVHPRDLVNSPTVLYVGVGGGMIEPMTAANSTWAESPAPSVADMLRMAQAAFDALPDEFRALAGEVEIRVQDFADAALLDEMGIEDAFELTGLYDGVDLARRSVFEATDIARDGMVVDVPFRE